MTPTAAQHTISQMVNRIVDKFHPYKIILFGSYAKGTAGPDSDVDLLVIMPLSVSKRQTTIAIRSELHGMGLPKDILVATPEDIETYRNTVGTIIRPALQEGRVLYERAA